MAIIVDYDLSIRTSPFFFITMKIPLNQQFLAQKTAVQNTHLKHHTAIPKKTAIKIITKIAMKSSLMLIPNQLKSPIISPNI